MSSQSASRAATTQVELTTVALGNLTGVFILAGATSALFGPLLVTFSHHFHVSLPVAGEALSVYFVGALIGVLPGWWGLKRTTGRRVLSASLIVVAAGTLSSGFVHSWYLYLACIFLLGVGFGSLDMCLNVLLSRTEEEGRAHRLSFVNAGYGLGAVICPVLIVVAHPQNFPAIFIGIAVVALLLTTFNRGVHAPPLGSETPQRRIGAANTQRWSILLTFVGAYVFYVALETSASGWMSSQLQRGGFSTSTGSVVTAAFWVGMTIGRSVGGPLHRILSDTRLVLSGLGLAIVTVLACTSNHVALVAYPLLGLILASVFPMGLMWYSRLVPFDSDGITIILFFMMAGGVIGPSGVSLLVSHFGVHVVPFTLAALALVDLAFFASVLRFSPVTDP
ncbi:MAG: MFS transporter [Acidobacteriota bacterium]|nr:MFS transporter [Acidobacteriota bacterium]